MAAVLDGRVGRLFKFVDAFGALVRLSHWKSLFFDDLRVQRCHNVAAVLSARFVDYVSTNRDKIVYGAEAARFHPLFASNFAAPSVLLQGSRIEDSDVESLFAFYNVLQVDLFDVAVARTNVSAGAALVSDALAHFEEVRFDECVTGASLLVVRGTSECVLERCAFSNVGGVTNAALLECGAHSTLLLSESSVRECSATEAIVLSRAGCAAQVRHSVLANNARAAGAAHSDGSGDGAFSIVRADFDDASLLHIENSTFESSADASSVRYQVVIVAHRIDGALRLRDIVFDFDAPRGALVDGHAIFIKFQKQTRFGVRPVFSTMLTAAAAAVAVAMRATLRT